MSGNQDKNVWTGYKKPKGDRRSHERSKRLSGKEYKTLKTRKKVPAKVPPFNAVSFLQTVKNKTKISVNISL